MLGPKVVCHSKVSWYFSPRMYYNTNIQHIQHNFKRNLTKKHMIYKGFLRFLERVSVEDPVRHNTVADVWQMPETVKNILKK